MKALQVTAEELQQWADDTEIELCGQFRQGYHASVKYHVGTNRYRVYDHREVVLSTPSAEDAAAAFNEIRPRREVTQP